MKAARAALSGGISVVSLLFGAKFYSLSLLFNRRSFLSYELIILASVEASRLIRMIRKGELAAFVMGSIEELTHLDGIFPIM